MSLIQFSLKVHERVHVKDATYMSCIVQYAQGASEDCERAEAHECNVGGSRQVLLRRRLRVRLVSNANERTLYKLHNSYLAVVVATELRNNRDDFER